MSLSPPALAATAAALLACTSNGGGALDAAADAPVDAPRGDCDAGEVESQGDWTDWDSSDQMFMGIFDATLAEGDNSVTTAPNGRAVICLTAGVEHVLSFSHPDYLPMTATLAADGLGAVYAARGLTPSRAEDLFTGELGLVRDAAAAQILVELPAGASASIDTTAAGEFQVPNADYLFFANVDVGGGSTGLSVSPPGGQSCTAPGSLDLAAGVTAFASVVCR